MLRLNKQLSELGLEEKTFGSTAVAVVVSVLSAGTTTATAAASVGGPKGGDVMGVISQTQFSALLARFPPVLARYVLPHVACSLIFSRVATMLHPIYARVSGFAAGLMARHLSSVRFLLHAGCHESRHE